MRVPLFLKRLTVLICLAVLQGQVLASSLLACQHFEATPGDATGCPFHAAPGALTPEQDPGPMLDCHKCALHVVFGNCHAASTPLALPLAQGTVYRGPFAASRWGDVPPERFLRPPIIAQR